MSLSEDVQIALITALAVAIPAIIAQLLLHMRQNKKLTKIHDQTNSNLTDTKNEVKEARTEIKDLNKHIRVLAEEKGKAEEQANPTEKI